MSAWVGHWKYRDEQDVARAPRPVSDRGVLVLVSVAHIGESGKDRSFCLTGPLKLYISTSQLGVWLCLTVLITNEIEHLSVSLLVIWVSSFKYLFTSFAHFSVICLFLMIYRNSLYIRYTALCRYIYCKYFLLLCACLFTALTGFFDEQILLLNVVKFINLCFCSSGFCALF